jgi:hypothetical protein
MYLAKNIGGWSWLTQAWNPETQTVAYTYDAGGGNATGQLTSESNGNSTTNFTAFDTMGEVTASSQVTDGQTYNFKYGYNLTGSLKSETFPSGRVVTTRGRPTTTGPCKVSRFRLAAPVP